MILLYPCDPFDRHLCDETFREEYTIAQSKGFQTSLFSFDHFEETNKLKTWPYLSDNDLVIYRGWMLTLHKYGLLYEAVKQQNAQLYTTPKAYELCHHLRSWYPFLAEYTSETHFVSERDIGKVRYRDKRFIKDYVKSLGPESIVHWHDFRAHVEKMQKRRGFIEGGICIRHVEHYVPDSERRYFVLDGTCYSPDDELIPPLVSKVVRTIKSPFYSVDIAVTEEGKTRIIELGDGQVSDLKTWAPDRFVDMLFRARQ